MVARDYGDNEATAGPLMVSALPTENGPQVVRVDPGLAAPGDPLSVFGRFFHPDSAMNSALLAPRSVDAASTSTAAVCMAVSPSMVRNTKITTDITRCLVSGMLRCQRAETLDRLWLQVCLGQYFLRLYLYRIAL